MLGALFAALKALAIILGWKQREDAKADGAAIQRDTDLRAENEKVAKADMARDDVLNGGGVPIEADPFNRDNR
jgi:hypothetical protein